MPDPLRQFGYFLFAGRNKKKLRSKDIAKILSVHENTPSNWENTKILPAKERLPSIAKAYELDEEELFALYTLALEQKNRYSLKEIRKDMKGTNYAVGDLFSGRVARSTRRIMHRF